MKSSILCAWFLALVLDGGVAHAQDRGPVTNLPMPRFVSLKANEANARRGPDRSHRIDWVYRRRDLPLRVTAEFEHWRLVEDMDGQGGWMHYALLSGVRTAMIREDLTHLLAHPQDGARDLALLESGVVGALQSCNPTWCRLQVDDIVGWVPKAAIWGVGLEEVLE